MNIDELKMILETINSTTGLAKDFGTTWIWLHYGFKVFDMLVLLLVVAVICYVIYRCVLAINGGGDQERFLRQCRDRLRIGSPGGMTDGEWVELRMKLTELIDRHNQEQRK